MHNLVQKFYTYEPALVEGLKKVMGEFGLECEKKNLYMQVAIYNIPSMTKIRELRTTSLGRLSCISGTVTRTTDTKPELHKGTFKCLICNAIVEGIEQQFKFTEPVRCFNPNCSNRTAWELINKESTMVDWQKVRLQEDSSEIPAGSMPRCIDVVLRGELVD